METGESERVRDPMLSPRHPTAVSCCKMTAEIIVILIICGILSLGLSVIFWTVYDFFVSPDVTDTTLDATLAPLETFSITIKTMPTGTTEPMSCQKRIIGFFDESDAKEITALRVSKLTHAVFAKIPMDYRGELDIKTQKTNETFEKFKSTAKSVKMNVKVMISIIGENNYQDVAEDADKLRKFKNSVSSFLKTHEIDGVDLNWETGRFSEGINLLKELRIHLNKGQLISVTLSSATNPEKNFQVDKILQYADFVNVVSMGYHDTDRTRTAPISPLYSKYDESRNLDVNATMDYFIKKSKNSEKLNIVIPFFARIWRNVSDVVESGKEMFRNARNEFSQISFRKMKEDGWKEEMISWDETSKSAYMYNSETHTFSTFENEKSIAWKFHFIKKNNLGGLWIRFTDMDDNENTLLNYVTKSC